MLGVRDQQFLAAHTFMIGVLVLLGLIMAFLTTPFRAATHGGNSLPFTRAGVDRGQLRIEGAGAEPNSAILVDGVTLGTSDDQGEFRVKAEEFSSPTCRVTVGDGVSSVEVALEKCSPFRPVGNLKSKTERSRLAIDGVPPAGRAECNAGKQELGVEVRDVNLPDGAVLTIFHRSLTPSGVMVLEDGRTRRTFVPSPSQCGRQGTLGIKAGGTVIPRAEAPWEPQPAFSRILTVPASEFTAFSQCCDRHAGSDTD